MNKSVLMEDIIDIIIEQIDKDGSVKFTPRGVSMLPVIRNNQDTVTLEKPVFPLKKYDVAFYVRDNGKYVLHRVIAVKKDSYTMRGDNQFRSESGIREDQIIAVATCFEKDGKTIYFRSRKHKLFAFYWCNTVCLRKVYKKTRRLLGKIKRKLIG